MLAFILLVLLVCVIAGILGAVVHGLLWLLIIAVVIAVGTLVFGGTRLRSGSRR